MAWLTRGSRGINVERVQGLLWQAGLYNGDIDGWFGPKLEKAITDWQATIGALPDGKWGPKTMQASARFIAPINNGAALNNGMAPVVPYQGNRQ